MSQYARTIHSSFSSGLWASSSSSSSPYATSASSAHANLLLGGYIHNKYPSSSSSHPSDWPARRRAPLIRPPAGQLYAPLRRSSRAQPASTTAAAAAAAAAFHLKFDPFSDDPISSSSPSSHSSSIPLPPAPSSSSSSYRLPPSGTSNGYRSKSFAAAHARTRTTSISSSASSPLTIRLEEAPPSSTPRMPALDRDARSRLVAGILLNRVHAVGKPIRSFRCREPREYVKSGLSTVISLEA